MMSETINELAEALAKAQGQITGALKDSANPFYKSRYADLASVWDACREALSANGLCVIQTTEGVDADAITVVTTLAHKSGQWIKGVLTMKPKDPGPQAAGSCLTYARRYALAAIVGVAQVDDDANAASLRPDRSGKPDTSDVDPELRDQYVAGFQNALIEADAKKVIELHLEVRTQPELYTAIGEKLSAKQRSDIRSIVGTKAA